MPSSKDAIGNDEGLAAEEKGGHELSDAEIKSDGRLDFMDQLADRVERERTGEVEQSNADEQIAAAEVAPSFIDDPAKYKVKVKLEGQEEELGLDEVLRGFQKDQVASRRMTEAAKMIRDAEEIKKQAQELLDSAKQGQAADDGGGNESKATPKAEQAKKVVEALIEGDEEAAVIALAELAGRAESSTQSKPDLSVNDVADEVKRQLEVDSALDAFAVEFKDISADPHLVDMTNRFLADEIKVNPDISEALKAAGNKTRDWINRLTGTTTGKGDDSTTTRDRAALKKGIDSMPGMSASSGSQIEAEETPADIINAMKAERGLIA